MYKDNIYKKLRLNILIIKAPLIATANIKMYPQKTYDFFFIRITSKFIHFVIILILYIYIVNYKFSVLKE
jgi:hypothetical protein